MGLYEVTRIGKHGRTGKSIGFFRARSRAQAAAMGGRKAKANKVRVFNTKIRRRKR